MKLSVRFYTADDVMAWDAVTVEPGETFLVPAGAVGCDIIPVQPVSPGLALLQTVQSWECPRCHCLFERPGFAHEPCEPPLPLFTGIV